MKKVVFNAVKYLKKIAFAVILILTCLSLTACSLLSDLIDAIDLPFIDKAKIYDIYLDDIFIENNLNKSEININSFDSKTVYLDVSFVPESLYDQFEKAIFELEEQLQIFEFKLVEDYDKEDIDFLPFSDAEHQENFDKKNNNEFYYVGWCKYNEGKYNPFTKLSSFPDKEISIDFVEFENTIFDEEIEGEIYAFLSADLPMYARHFRGAYMTKESIALYNEISENLHSVSVVQDPRLLKLANRLRDELIQGNIPEAHRSDILRMENNLRYVFLNSIEGARQKFVSTIKHEMLHALFFAKDIDQTNAHYEEAQSIMQYNTALRTYDISDFDREYVIKPAILLALSLNDKLCEDNDIKQNEVMKIIEEMLLEKEGEGS